jgi:hypothetical protein
MRPPWTHTHRRKLLILQGNQTQQNAKLLILRVHEIVGFGMNCTDTPIGNAYLKWAFSEAAGLFLRANPAVQKRRARIEKKHGKGKALTVLAHKLARAVYDMLKRHTAFEMRKFLTQ